MDTTKATSIRLNGRALDPRPGGPVVPRMLLGAHLRRLRETRGLSLEQAGRVIQASAARMRELELGRTGCGPQAVGSLLTRYGVVDRGECATVLALADQADTPGWWQSYRDVIAPWLLTYVEVEQSAAVIRRFEVQFVPVLLQTEDYARAVIRLGHPRAPDAEIERRVELRLRRQGILRRARPPHVWAVIDEGALRRAPGGAAVMRAQIRRLIDLGDLPHVTVHMLPFEAGRCAAASGPVCVLRMAERELPDVVCLERLASAVYPDEPAELDYYRHVMNRLVTEAEPAPATRTLLHWIRDET